MLEGRHNLKAGNYTFTAAGGIRVFLVDGKPIIDEWRVQLATTYRASTYLESEEHKVNPEVRSSWLRSASLSAVRGV